MTILKLIVCSDQIFDASLYEEKFLQTIELITLNSHIINTQITLLKSLDLLIYYPLVKYNFVI